MTKNVSLQEIQSNTSAYFEKIKSNFEEMQDIQNLSSIDNYVEKIENLYINK